MVLGGSEVEVVCFFGSIGRDGSVGGASVAGSFLARVPGSEFGWGDV